jgi:acyl-CoA reductase-like NAD-dependent aldehyde dehydrogenase
VVGGTDLPEGVDRGWYVRPTLFADVTNDMRIAREEIFGPVLSVIPYREADEAVRLANDSDYGLSGSVWTADLDRGLAVARGVRTGTFGVNQPYSMDPLAPFGGVKASGFGREFGAEGLDEFLDTKAISMAPAP